MPSTVAGLLIMLFAVLPGIPGERLYGIFMGFDWRESHWRQVLRLMLFSLLGVALYSVFASAVGLPQPEYLVPSRLAVVAEEPGGIRHILSPFLGHVAAATAVGAVAAGVARLLAKRTALSLFPGAWDYFVTCAVANHWVVVGLKNGDSYAGILGIADKSVAASDRDIVLDEPAEYDSARLQYVSSVYQMLYIPGDQIASLAVVHDPLVDTRVAAVGEDLFLEGNPDDRREQGQQDQQANKATDGEQRNG